MKYLVFQEKTAGGVSYTDLVEECDSIEELARCLYVNNLMSEDMYDVLDDKILRYSYELMHETLRARLTEDIYAVTEMAVDLEQGLIETVKEFCED